MEYTPNSPFELDLTGLDREEPVIEDKKVKKNNKKKAAVGERKATPVRTEKQTAKLARQRARYHEKKKKRAALMGAIAMDAADANDKWNVVVADDICFETLENWASPLPLRLPTIPLDIVDLENDPLFLPYPVLTTPDEPSMSVVIQEREPPTPVVYAQTEHPIPNKPGWFVLI